MKSKLSNVNLALLSGLLLSVGWPTWGFPLFLFVGFVPLLYAEWRIRNKGQKGRGGRVFFTAFLAFLVWNILKTNWLWFSTEFGALFAIVVNALLMSCLFLLYHHFAKRVSFFLGAIFLTCLWIGFEKLHLNWDFSWPWLNLGNGFSEYYSWVQWYAYTGSFGGTLWVWVVNFVLFRSLLLKQASPEKDIRVSTFLPAAILVVFPIALSLAMFYTYEEKGDTAEMLVLQPNIDPYSEKYEVPNEEIADLLIALAETAITEATRFVIAPETVFADNERIERLAYAGSTEKLKDFISKHPQANFLTGVSLYRVFEDEEQATPQTNVAANGLFYNTYNSAMLLTPHSDSLALYHKSKLVVGVESTPYVGIIKPLLGDIMLDLGGTVAMKTTQDERSVFSDVSGQLRAAPIICYESVYGEFVTGYVRNDANFLAIITNDAWWGNTQGHKQHWSYARLRAIETRRSIARSANTGISGYINQRGQTISQTDYDTPAALRGVLHLNNEQSFYTRYGDMIYRIAMFVWIGIVLIAFTRRRHQVGELE